VVTGAPPKIIVQSLTKSFPDSRGGVRRVLDRVSFSVPDGAFVSIIGPSGCGKSTTLNIIAGLVTPDAGHVDVGGRRVAGGERQRTRVGYVFQQPRLLNWLTVRENIEFVLDAGEVPRTEWASRVDAALRLVGLAEFHATYPLRLSGGQQQRAAIARALATEPEVVLMDEPFSHLDEITSARLRTQLMEIWQRTGKTILFVTHDISEAVLLSDRVIVLGRGGAVLADESIDVPRPRGVAEDAVFDIERRMRGLVTTWWTEVDEDAEAAR
jgi:ABC-type nitrate/sulfonate/bicarbonate transport system ATPase subunit